MEELDQILSTTHAYRKQLAEIERRNGSATQDVVDNAFKVNGEQRQALDRMDADLTAAELRAQAKALEARLSKLEAQPTLTSRSPSAPGADAEAQYAERFARALFSGNRLAFERVMAERTNVTTAATNSTSAIPTIWQDRIVERINQFNVFRSVCPVRNVVGDQKIVVGGALPTAYKVTEAAAVTEDTTFAVANVDVLDIMYGVYVPVSRQYQNDAIGGLEYVARKSGEALANLLETEYTTGAGGAGNMPGLLSFSIQNGGDIGSAIADLTGDDLIDVAHSILPQYRRGNVGYMMNDTVLRTVRKIKIASGSSEYIWKPPATYSDIRDGVPSTIYGFPVYVNQAMTNAAGDKAIVFGNWDYYEIYDRDGGASVMIDPYGLSTSFMNRVVVGHRTYGVCTNNLAFAYLTV